MNDFVKRYLMQRDGRNPYGSRGGYVTSHRPRDFCAQGTGYERNSQYNSMEHDFGQGYSPYQEHEYPQKRRDYARDRQYYGYLGDMPFEVRQQYPWDGGYRNPHDYMDTDYDYPRDYGDTQIRLNKQDFIEWKSKLRNEDGSTGAHFTKDQIEQVARQINLNKNEFEDETFCMTVNMLYSDYCKVMKKYGMDRLEVYLDMAYAFLKDEDFKGEPEEKLALYYRCIAKD